MHNRRFAAKQRRRRPVSALLACGFTLGSSSALRGIATACWSRHGATGPPSSSALRGIATRRIPTCRATSRPSPHPPYEGSQRGGYRHAGRHPGPVLIRPTRDRNAADTDVPGDIQAQSSSALRGIATRRIPTCRATSRPSPHPPYEGSQLVGPGLGAQVHQRVLIRPTRDRNTRCADRSHRSSSPHPPYEGSQPYESTVTGSSQSRSSYALRGIATRTSRRSSGRTQGPHPPYKDRRFATSALGQVGFGTRPGGSPPGDRRPRRTLRAARPAGRGGGAQRRRS